MDHMQLRIERLRRDLLAYKILDHVNEALL